MRFWLNLSKKKKKNAQIREIKITFKQSVSSLNTFSIYAPTFWNTGRKKKRRNRIKTQVLITMVLNKLEIFVQ